MNPLLSLMQTFFGGGSVPDQPKAPRSSGKSSLDSLNELARLDQTSRHKRVDANGNNLVGQPTGLDYLDMYGPDRESVKLRTQALNAQVQDPNIVARGKAAVEARKREQADMLPQYGPHDVMDLGHSGVKIASRNGQPVGYSTTAGNDFLPPVDNAEINAMRAKAPTLAQDAQRQNLQAAINYGYLNSDLPNEVGQIDTALLNGGRGAKLPVETPPSPMTELPAVAPSERTPPAPSSKPYVEPPSYGGEIPDQPMNTQMPSPGSPRTPKQNRALSLFISQNQNGNAFWDPTGLMTGNIGSGSDKALVKELFPAVNTDTDWQAIAGQLTPQIDDRIAELNRQNAAVIPNAVQNMRPEQLSVLDQLIDPATNRMIPQGAFTEKNLLPGNDYMELGNMFLPGWNSAKGLTSTFAPSALYDLLVPYVQARANQLGLAPVRPDRGQAPQQSTPQLLPLY